MIFVHPVTVAGWQRVGTLLAYSTGLPTLKGTPLMPQRPLVVGAGLAYYLGRFKSEWLYT